MQQPIRQVNAPMDKEFDGSKTSPIPPQQQLLQEEPENLPTQLETEMAVAD